MSLINLTATFLRTVPRVQLSAVSARRNVHRWVGPTLRELKKRREKMGPEAERPRSSHSDWNYNAEIFAFGKRLQENFDSKLLQQAFTHRSFIVQEEKKQSDVGIDQPVLGMTDNQPLMELGERLIGTYVRAFLLTALPKLPQQFVTAVQEALTSETQLAHISRNIGTRDIVLAAEFPVADEQLAGTLKAIVGALHQSSGDERTYLFVRDFLCTELNQRDVNEYFAIERPLEVLGEYCKEKGMAEPEPRLIGCVGKNTLLAAYNVGIYCDRKLLGTGFGEDTSTAIDQAAWDCLRKLFGTELSMNPIDFSLGISDVSRHLSAKATAKANRT